MTSPTKSLYEDHDAILLLLDVLEQLAGLERQGALPLEAAAAAVDLVRRFADDAHHGKEERLLFPALVSAGLPRRHGPIAVMLHEHDQGREQVRRMVDGLAAARAAADRGRFAEAAEAYARQLRSHIGKENQVLFPMAEELISPGALAAVGAAFEAIEREALGEGGAPAARAAVRRLAEQVLGPARAAAGATPPRGCC